MKLELFNVLYRKRRKSDKRELSPEELSNLQNPQVLEGNSVDIITHEDSEEFTKGAHLEAIEVSRADLVQAESLLEVLDASRLEEVGMIIWRAFRNRGLSKKAVELVINVKEFMRQAIRANGLWVGEHAIIFEASGGLGLLNSHKYIQGPSIGPNQKTNKDNEPKFRMIVEEGHFVGGIKRVVSVEEYSLPS